MTAPDPPESKTGTNRDLLGFLSQHAINTTPTPIVPDSNCIATDLHDRDTDKHGPTRHLHELFWTYTTTRTNTASIRTKPDLHRTDNNLYKTCQEYYGMLIVVDEYGDVLPDRAWAPRQILQIRIANLKHDLADGAVCDPKAIHQTVVNVPGVRYRKDILERPSTYTAATQFTCRVITDMNGVDPASVRDWGFNQRG
ncbi:hypothetical protein DPMN_074405 [Dreissena polymorpha]|uniref:Uncharacterized protein n=1 Tax=Dreissena polymorpha TaxID=45954 RepID=A0A9D4BE11_DREPO|nr:hypothetical protein DPMN_074405 [Dreissena polymorpha]